ncbi:tyrosine-type recombinase/integrase [Chryseobacterium rhizosphaerae]|uniref:tyrosine-type recombinase/integrase n=1 Tax=Chryseobacterium rhizosphaerae TaxID=395937 RepID=UPI0023592D6D|nr:tyrosine-type recombinase/integrase [Chryseobacterium rhizosphaerae]MDC8098601.1 tyrosine-type recombinase/integrase [Chryseobacterium rhizosphaerae]
MAQYSNETGSVNFRLKEPKSEISRIMGRYSFKGLQADFSTGLKVTPSSWDSDTKTVTSGADKREINQKLGKFKTSIVDAHKNFNGHYNRLPTKEELKTIVNNAVEGKEHNTVQKNKKSFDDVFQEFMRLIELKIKRAIASNQKPLHKSYVSSFNVMYRDLKDFATDNSIFLDIDKFDETQCLEFQNWLLGTERVGELSTLRTRIKRLSAVLKRGFEKGYTENRSYMQDEFSVKVPPSFHTVLTEPEIKILFEHDFSDSPRLERVRDLFVLGCHSSLRFGDITRIESGHIDTSSETISILLNKGSRVDKYKTVNFPIFGYAGEILNKYDNDIKSIAISNQNTNEYLKELFKEIPYFNEKVITRERPTNEGVVFETINFTDKVAFHDSRRSFCTNRYIEGWDLLEIWQYTGHTDESIFKTYFKPTFEHEQIRQESIKARNEKLQKVDLQTKEIEELKAQMQKMEELIKSGNIEQLAEIVNINKNVS